MDNLNELKALLVERDRLSQDVKISAIQPQLDSEDKIFDLLPALLSELEEMRWRTSSEEKPDLATYERILVWTPGYTVQIVNIGTKGWFDATGWTYWRPLPQPPAPQEPTE
jgi:hypothetical protein